MGGLLLELLSRLKAIGERDESRLDTAVGDKMGEAASHRNVYDDFFGWSSSGAFDEMGIGIRRD